MGEDSVHVEGIEQTRALKDRHAHVERAGTASDHRHGTIASEPETIGARIRRLRRERGLGMVRLAFLIGVSKPTLWKWETDRTQPRLAALEKLSLVLDVSLEELQGDRGRRMGTAANRAEMRAAGGATAGGDRKLFATIVDRKSRIASIAGVNPDEVTITLRF